MAPLGTGCPTQHGSLVWFSAIQAHRALASPQNLQILLNFYFSIRTGQSTHGGPVGGARVETGTILSATNTCVGLHTGVRMGHPSSAGTAVLEDPGASMSQVCPPLPPVVGTTLQDFLHSPNMHWRWWCPMNQCEKGQEERGGLDLATCQEWPCDTFLGGIDFRLSVHPCVCPQG